MGELAQQVRRLQHGDHVCLIYETLGEQVAAIVPFLQEGFARNECCAYIVDDRTAEEISAALAKHGIDVERERARGALVFLTKREAYLKHGSFDPSSMLELLRQTMEEALAAGFTGARITGEMTWALGPETGCDRLIEYEALINQFFPRSASLAICQYNRRRFAPEVIRDVMRTHPLAVVRSEVHENLFYETPEMVLGKESAATRVDWMISQLERVRAGERKLVDLGAQLAQQAFENDRLYREAQEAVRLRDEFLSVASHELKTPLTPLQLKLQSLKREAQVTHSGAVPAERVTRAVQSAEEQIRKLGDLINDLLDVSRLSEGKLWLRKEEVDFSAVLNEVVLRFGGEAAKAGCCLEVDARRPVIGWWDRQRLEQVVTNLLTNAIKYGEGKPIHLILERTGDRARLTVRDQGIGIDSKDLMRIFGKFERAVSERNYGGLGLGLYITQQIVQALHGEIRVDSQLGAGATFTVELPCARGDT